MALTRNRIGGMTMPLRWHMDNSTRHVESPQLDALRTRAQDLLNAEDWTQLYQMRPELKADTALWGDFWGPVTAVAARQVGDPSALSLLQSLVDDGFRQPELFGDLLERSFADDPSWPALLSQMQEGVAQVPITLLDWPVRRPASPLGLFALPDRADELRTLIPAPSDSAWDTALTFLKWVTFRWQHANAHMEVDDAVECLHRVDQGQRYACVEYSLVLSQALNAVGIPARRVSLRQRDYHVGLGRGHVVSEAWIDDLSRWVLLDGQNGMYWTSEDGLPLGTVDLQRMALQSSRRPQFFTYRDGMSASDADLWFTYFAHATSTAGTWSPGPFALPFQREWIVTSRRLEQDPVALYPDLSAIGVETALSEDQPALRLATYHPYSTAFLANSQRLDGDLYPLDMRPGEHQVELAVATPYGSLSGKTLRYRVN